MTGRWTPLLVAFSAAVLVSAAMASAVAGSQAPPGATRVEVVVSHADGRSLDDAPVMLDVHDGRQTLATLEGRTDEAGRVGWEEVPAAAGYHARATVLWSGVRYPSDTVTLAPDEPARLAIEVFETTDQGRPLHLDTLHLILQMEEPGVVRVLQFMTVSNAGDAAYAGGPELEDGRRAGIVIPLPTGATRLAAAPFPTGEEALVLSEAEVRPDAVLDPRPVPPEGRQVALTYDMVFGDDGAEFSYELPYPTASVSVLLGGPAADAVELETSDLDSRPGERIGDQQFDLWAADALQPGAEIAFTVGSGGVRIAVEHWALIGLAAGLLLALAGTWLGSAGRVRTEAERDQILRRVAALDLRHDAGEIESGEYFERRGRELERLAMLERLAGARGSVGRERSSGDPEPS